MASPYFTNSKGGGGAAGAEDALKDETQNEDNVAANFNLSGYALSPKSSAFQPIGDGSIEENLDNMDHFRLPTETTEEQIRRFERPRGAEAPPKFNLYMERSEPLRKQNNGQLSPQKLKQNQDKRTNFMLPVSGSDAEIMAAIDEETDPIDDNVQKYFGIDTDLLKRDQKKLQRQRI